jgi:hypothetical protein
LLNLADADPAQERPDSRIIVRSDLTDVGVCRALIGDGVSAPEEVRIPFLVGRPAQADS